MILTIDLPREGDGCNPNRARCLHRFRQAADAKHARTVGLLYAQQAMRDEGIAPGTFVPRVVLLTTFWNGHDVDVDNTAACIKAYQDGIFDALGCNDRGIVALLSMKRWTALKEHHRCKRITLYDDVLLAQQDAGRLMADAVRAADSRAQRMRKGKEGGHG